jgi:hypothetical protein
MKDLKNIPTDVYGLLENGKEASDENLEITLNNIRELLVTRLQAPLQEREPYLRMSAIGKPQRQVWYELNSAPSEKFDGKTLLKFLYGDLIEELLLFLVREAGYEVTDQQKEVELNGVVGHMDAKINGTVVDVKSASAYAFKKFNEGTLRESDTFGYYGQLAGYTAAEGGGDGAFLAMDKQSGGLALLSVSSDELDFEQPSVMIDNHRQALESDTPPPRCYDPEPMGKKGNMKLGINCSYCKFKEHCWQDANNGKGLRTFFYANGPVFLTEVKDLPRVPEKK